MRRPDSVTMTIGLAVVVAMLLSPWSGWLCPLCRISGANGDRSFPRSRNVSWCSFRVGLPRCSISSTARPSRTGLWSSPMRSSRKSASACSMHPHRIWATAASRMLRQCARQPVPPSRRLDPPPPSDPVAAQFSLVSIGAWVITALVLAALLSLVAARRVVKPLSELSGALDRLGPGGDDPSVPPHGPREIEGIIRAFNRMRERLRRFNEDRTRMMAAMSHDIFGHR
jgi:HAMP domain-containing protein